MRALRIHEAATDEAAEAAAWYERERPGLGAEFERAVDAALDLLEEDIVPLASVPRRGWKARNQATNTQTFSLFCHRPRARRGIFVIAFAHHARRPGYWRDRLRA